MLTKLTSRNRLHLQKLIFPTFYRNWWFIATFTTAHQWSLLWILLNPGHTFPSYLRSILILSSHLHLVLSSGLIPSGCPVKALYASLFSSGCSAYLPHLIHYFIILVQRSTNHEVSHHELQRGFTCDPEQGEVAVCEHGNESSGPIKFRQCLD